MAIRIIDNKKIEVTDSEWQMYQDICKSYDRSNFKGSDLFRGIFESNDQGIIVFIRPSSTNHTSMEVLSCMQILQQNQQLRIIKNHFDGLCKKVEEKMEKLDKLIAENTPKNS